MSLNIWEGLNIGLEYDSDDQGATFQINLDHDEVKGDVKVELINLLEEELNESFDTAEDIDIVQENVIPEYEGIREYFLNCIQLIDQKIIEAKDFISENS